MSASPRIAMVAGCVVGAVCEFTAALAIGWDNDDGYHSDKYNDVEELPFKLDRGNLRKVTGLKNLPGNDDSFSSDESEDDEKGKGEDDGEDGAGEIGDYEEEEKDKR